MPIGVAVSVVDIVKKGEVRGVWELRKKERNQRNERLPQEKNRSGRIR
jgi:hypothetical protein